jgi:hypothetical protein
MCLKVDTNLALTPRWIGSSSGCKYNVAATPRKEVVEIFMTPLSIKSEEIYMTVLEIKRIVSPTNKKGGRILNLSRLPRTYGMSIGLHAEGFSTATFRLCVRVGNLETRLH